MYTLKLLKPFEPGASRPWDRAAAQHLLRRAGFAASEEESRAALEAGPKEAVNRLVAGSTESERHAELDALGKSLALRDDLAGLRGWWLLRMCHTKRPLHARMTLFWHNHFATSNAKVRNSAMMLQQLRTLEKYALGPFEEMLRAISRDAAMIVWLDGKLNTKGRPNENYARELFELFSLGVGNYSERDIKEAARAFTGWHERGGAFYFSEREHDDGPKTIFGNAGNWGGDDVVRLALRQPAGAEFLATKLLREFLCPTPPAELVEEFAGAIRETNYDITTSLAVLLGSEAMFDPRWYRARIKSPVELAVGVVRSLGISAFSAAALADFTSQAGQRLLEPPSVKGWDGHRSWLNSATMLVRLNGAARASGDALPAGELRGRYALDGVAAIEQFCAALLLDERVPAAVRAAYPVERGDLDAYFRGVVGALVSCPEYQMA